MKSEIARIFIGWDKREPVAFHVCAESIIRHSSIPVCIVPLALNNLEKFYQEQHVDGSNGFIYSRFLVPYLCDWKGHALYLDGDMLIRSDIAELWALRRADRGVHVVRHPDYQTKHPTKYLGAANPDYPRKNWSSVILWNCNYFPNRVLTPDYVTKAPGSYLHRFEWLKDNQIEPLPAEWNHLVAEHDPRPDAKLAHFTIGTPCFGGQYAKQEFSGEWFDLLYRLVTDK